jgi:hypothetical protein
MEHAVDHRVDAMEPAAARVERLLLAKDGHDARVCGGGTEISC